MVSFVEDLGRIDQLLTEGAAENANLLFSSLRDRVVVLEQP